MGGRWRGRRRVVYIVCTIVHLTYGYRAERASLSRRRASTHPPSILLSSTLSSTEEKEVNSKQKGAPPRRTRAPESRCAADVSSLRGQVVTASCYERVADELQGIATASCPRSLQELPVLSVQRPSPSCSTLEPPVSPAQRAWGPRRRPRPGPRHHPRPRHPPPAPAAPAGGMTLRGRPTRPASTLNARAAAAAVV